MRVLQGKEPVWRYMRAAAAEPHELAHWATEKQQAIRRGLDFLQNMGETMFRNEQLASKHGPDILLPFYIPPATATRATEEDCSLYCDGGERPCPSVLARPHTHHRY